tara:strand:+ start:313 stop:723 length:411 start_codon:yes stop_codon:yes gene_type:complete
MNFDWKSFRMNEQIILGSFAIAVLSMFLPWVNLEIMTLNGFQQQGYIFLVALIYPVIFILRGVKYNSLIALILAVITVILTIWFISTKSLELYDGQSVNVSGSGLWLFLICIIAFTFSLYKELGEDDDYDYDDEED